MKKIINLLKQGKTIIYPTDTAYALGGDFLNEKTREKIYQIKKRDKTKELSVIANSLSMIKKYCIVNKTEEALAKKHWPGPFTIVFNVKKKYQNILGKTLGARVPNNVIARTLSKNFNKPLIATSANISGKSTCYSVEDVLKQFSKHKIKAEIVVDYGVLDKVPVSTIIKIVDGKIEVIRKGNIKLK